MSSVQNEYRTEGQCNEMVSFLIVPKGVVQRVTLSRSVYWNKFGLFGGSRVSKKETNFGIERRPCESVRPHSAFLNVGEFDGKSKT